MASLFLKDEIMDASPSIVGYRILHYIQRKGASSISIFDLANHFKDEKWFSPKILYFGMIFLFSVGLVEFQEPYVVINVPD